MVFVNVQGQSERSYLHQYDKDYKEKMTYKHFPFIVLIGVEHLSKNWDMYSLYLNT